MSIESGKFEHLEHRNPSGEIYDVPLYVGENKNITQESPVLLDAVNLLSENLQQFETGLSGLIDRVGEMLSDPEHNGLIIEDEHGGGSVRIDGEITQVRVRGKGISEIPTSLFFDMIWTWAEYQSEES